MKSEEAKYFLNIINEIQYEENAFTVWYGEDKIVLGAILFDSPEAQKFFSFATIYHTILDVDKKIKYSFKESIRWTDEILLRNGIRFICHQQTNRRPYIMWKMLFLELRYYGTCWLKCLT